MNHPALFEREEFRTARPARHVYCHQEFLDKLAERHNEPVGKRAALVMQRMAVDISRLHYKATSGANRGWRRSRLGGSSGSHFYAWWAPLSAAPLKEAGFEGEAEAIFLRDIRHHDEHAPLSPGRLADDYLQLTVPDLRGTEYAPEPWTPTQARFARGRGVVRILKGHPGSGKTTALLHAADASLAERVLYLTYSSDLAALARDYFDRFCSQERTFTVLTYSAFLQRLLGNKAPVADAAEARARFRRDLFSHQRSLGPWTNHLDALYNEMHAHLVGAAMPEQAGRFPKAERLRMPDQVYRSQRSRYLSAASDYTLEAARRLERGNPEPLADRYFPELAQAWRAATALTPGTRPTDNPFGDYGCIAVDEVQDLTPLETFVVLSLARRFSLSRGLTTLLLAGDEAQTVRPTDFEWAWLNDMLHALIGQPNEYKLTSNLRSPRHIADIVNRVWDLYDFLDKQDRPSGTGYAEIEDDSPDQVLFAAVPPGEVEPLLQSLAEREGLALIAFDKNRLPASVMPFVLSPAEAKGLDFHSVCVLNGAPLLREIMRELSTDPTRSLERRLAIDQLRVALSRPAERLFWIDTAPDAESVRQVGFLLRSQVQLELHPVTAEALRTALEEEELDVEERLQRCEKDARQLVTVKPDLAWSRARQAVNLLGFPGGVHSVSDRAVRESAYFTLAEVCFRLAFQNKKLSPELGKLDLYAQAREAAGLAGKPNLSSAIGAIGEAEKSFVTDRLSAVARAMEAVTEARKELPGWLLVDFTPRALLWLDEMDRNLEAGSNAVFAADMIPAFVDAINLPDAQARKDRLLQRSVRVLMKSRRHAQALRILERLPEARPTLAAECYEELGQFAKSAAIWLASGDRDRALKCYRSIPDFQEALTLVREIDGHAARPSLEWLAELDSLLARRPDNFNRTMTAPEKKLLEGMLERGLGVQRAKPAPRKRVGTGSSAKKAAPKVQSKETAKKAPKKRE